jgi:hypothetical protein
MEDYYVVVTRENLREVAERTGWRHYDLKSNLQDAEYRDCSLVVFSAEEEWHYIFVSNEYSVQWVMTQLARRWGIYHE